MSNRQKQKAEVEAETETRTHLTHSTRSLSNNKYIFVGH